MTTLPLDSIWDVLGGILSLNPEAFRAIRQFSDSDADTITFLIVFSAGFSQAVAQSIILFANRVKPLRFFISLLLAALLFVVGYLFWSLSIWVTGLLVLRNPIPWQTVTDVLAFGYLPLTFSFFGALPYLGVPILRVLSVWNLLAVVVGFATLAQLTAREAIWHVGLGWLVLLMLQQTVGQPIVNLGRWLTNKVAGVKLVVNRRQLEALINQGNGPELQSVFTPGGTEISERRLTQDVRTTQLARPLNAEGPSFSEEPEPTEAPFTDLSTFFPEPVKARSASWWKSVLLYVGLALLALITAIALDPLRDVVLGWYTTSSTWVQLALDLTWIGAVAMVVGGLLAPVEALGWWAGWYGDDIQIIEVEEEPAVSSPQSDYSRYVVYLDGIGQSTNQYQPSVAQFLTELEQRLPEDIRLVKGLMSYSVLNRSLTEDRPLAFFWRWADSLQSKFLGAWFGIFINLRNVMIVAVSADLRYGPIYNQGIAQQIYESLLRLGYPHPGGIPLTLIGYSGGGQISMGTLPFLRRALQTPIEVISLGGVISGNVNALDVEQLYHLVGRRDPVERVGPVMFPRRWPIAMLSYWNRAKQKGRISFISLGPVGHQVPGGIFDPRKPLPDGRTHLEQTLDLVMEILTGDLRHLLDEQKAQVLKPGRYYRYQVAPFNRPDYYPPIQTVETALYRPVADWVGRLILPEKHERATLNGVWLELLHTPAEYRQWLGHRVPLRWQQTAEVQHRVQSVTRDIHFSAEADYSYSQGTVLPIRLNHWRLVDPLESLAGAHPEDDLIVKLPHPVQVHTHPTQPPHSTPPLTPPSPITSPSPFPSPPFSLHITHDPIQITGRFYALVQFLGPVDDQLERYRVVHYRPETRQFDGPEDVVCLPSVVPDANTIYSAVNQGIEKTPHNQTGWYIYGAQNHAGEFIVKALRPRCLHQVQPDRLITRKRQGYRYIRKETWSNLAAKKGTADSILIDPGATSLDQAVDSWQEGDRALLVHIYGGIGGNKKEPAARGPIYFGHFAYGIATVVRDPLAEELQFEVKYHQVYTHNTQGLIAGTFDWTRYMGDRQWGFLGTRPSSDILIRLPAFTDSFDFYGEFESALDGLQNQLEIMTARYRTGDGTGVTYVGPANNCAQDSNQAMYASARHLEEVVADHKAAFRNWETDHPDQAQTFEQLLALRKDIQRGLLPLGSARADWEEEREVLGSNLQDYPLKTLGRGLVSWRTILPRKASDTITKICLRHGAALWVLRTNQLGGYDPDIEPLPPITL